ncbi:MAG: ABC transporter permease [Deltaproteobacteria bacterium]|jgi:putative ABC transport system permease protein|nr:ABC transporter permease [Deltaproteobacteria bacterium]
MITRSDLVRISLRQVLRQRSYGVVFSIALGIMAFITLSVLGREIRYNIGQDMVLLGGVNVIQVFLNDINFPGSPQQEFLPESVEAIRSLPGVFLVGRNTWGSKAQFTRVDERSVVLTMTGVDQHFWEIYAATLQTGRFLTEEDVRERRRVCLLGRDLSREIFGDRNPVGEPVFFGNEAFEVVGTFSGVMMGEWMHWAFMPYTTAVDRNFSDGLVNRLFVRAVSWEDVPRLVREIPDAIARSQKVNHLEIRTQDEQLVRIRTIFVWVEVLLWLGIAASLMLGGFGIWYGTFAAVRARTREVGLKKAMGGADVDILAQFLTEALCKSVAGGIAGIAFGIVVVEAGALLLGCSLSYVLLAASSAGSIVFSAVIGIAGGAYPAIQASRMDVVSALRFE